jgi:amidase
MSAHDPRDVWQVPAPLEGPPVAKRVALCFAPDGMPVAPTICDALRAAADRLANAGWDVAETDAPPTRRAAELQMMMWLSEAQRVGAAAVAKEADPDATEVWARLEGYSPPPTLERFMDALQERATIVRAWRVFLDRHTLLLCPVSGALPFRDQADLDGPEAFDRIWQAQLTQIGLPLTGCPGLSVATGFAEGAPVGVQLIAAPFREDVLLYAGEIAAGPDAPGVWRG